jgi:hypothetical protein
MFARVLVSSSIVLPLILPAGAIEFLLSIGLTPNEFAEQGQVMTTAEAAPVELRVVSFWDQHHTRGKSTSEHSTRRGSLRTQ